MLCDQCVCCSAQWVQISLTHASANNNIIFMGCAMWNYIFVNIPSHTVEQKRTYHLIRFQMQNCSNENYNMKSILRQMRIKIISGRFFLSFAFSFIFIAISHNTTMELALFSVPHAINTEYRCTRDYKLFLHWFFHNIGICWVILLYTHGIF